MKTEIIIQGCHAARQNCLISYVDESHVTIKARRFYRDERSRGILCACPAFPASLELENCRACSSWYRNHRKYRARRMRRLENLDGRFRGKRNRHSVDVCNPQRRLLKDTRVYQQTFVSSDDRNERKRIALCSLCNRRQNVYMRRKTVYGWCINEYSCAPTRFYIVFNYANDM